MRRWFRAHEVRVYRTLFIGVFLLATVILGKGVFTVFQEGVEHGARQMFELAAQTLVKQIGQKENARLAYAAQLHGEDKLFASLAGTRLVGRGGNSVDSIPVLSGSITDAAEEDPLEPLFPDDSIGEESKVTSKEMEDVTGDAGIFSDTDLFQTGKEPADNSDKAAGVVDTEQEALAELAAAENHAVKEEPKLEVVRKSGKITPLPAQGKTPPEGDNSDKTGEQQENTQKADGSPGKKGEGEAEVVSVRKLLNTEYSLEKMKNLNYLLANFYIVDSSTKATASLFQTELLLNKDMTIEKSDDEIQILIYHTHASETFSDSRAGVQEDTVVGPGNYLTELLTKKGFQVYHDQTAYDKKDGKDNRNYAYSTARPHIEAFLAKHPSVQVVIDLHRDSGTKRVAMVNGKETAQIMLFNGLCRNANGPIADLENPNILDNLAFSLQTNLVGRSMYPGLMHKIYLKNYRYNQHLCQRYLLIELGTQQNTVQEAYNAMEPLAEILNQVLTNP